MYAIAITECGGTLESCLGFRGGTVICIARPRDNEMQRAAYDAHKRKQVIKFQALPTPDCLIAHAVGPLEGRLHEWTLYVRSGVDEQLEEILLVEGRQFYVYGDSG